MSLFKNSPILHKFSQLSNFYNEYNILGWLNFLLEFLVLLGVSFTARIIWPGKLVVLPSDFGVAKKSYSIHTLGWLISSFLLDQFIFWALESFSTCWTTKVLSSRPASTILMLTWRYYQHMRYTGPRIGALELICKLLERDDL